MVVAGTGVAGCSAALAAARSGGRVALLTKESEPQDTNTRYAQGGIIYTAPDDSPELLTHDVLRAGAGAGERAAARLLAEEGPKLVERLLIDELHVPFGRGADGRFMLTREGAHSVARIIHRKDTTGDAIQTSLWKAVTADSRIEVLPGARLTSLLMRDGRCLGVRDSGRGENRRLLAGSVVLATGGYGGLYERTTNPASATGDGLSLAIKAGAAVRDLHYVQFHPTVLYEPRASGRAALISEAVRGEGGVLVTASGDEFLEHPGGSLAPRDVVTREIFDVMQKSGRPCVYLDATPHRTGRAAGWFAKRFPEIYVRCLAAGIDPDEEPVPVSPAAHYVCGGVATDLAGRTNVAGLFAAGEVASTGLHGANRLASTSLLEGLLFGWRAGEAAVESGLSPGPVTDSAGFGRAGATEEESVLLALGKILWERAGIVRDASGLRAGLREISHLEERASGTTLEGTLLVARAVTESALADDMSLGCHYRADAPARRREADLASIFG
ncbi:MAG: L-aspartate oxidase [Rubrobacter sp.]